MKTHNFTTEERAALIDLAFRMRRLQRTADDKLEGVLLGSELEDVLMLKGQLLVAETIMENVTDAIANYRGLVAIYEQERSPNATKG